MCRSRSGRSAGRSDSFRRGFRTVTLWCTACASASLASRLRPSPSKRFLPVAPRRVPFATRRSPSAPNPQRNGARPPRFVRCARSRDLRDSRHARRARPRADRRHRRSGGRHLRGRSPKDTPRPRARPPSRDRHAQFRGEPHGRRATRRIPAFRPERYHRRRARSGLPRMDATNAAPYGHHAAGGLGFKSIAQHDSDWAAI